MDNIYVFEFDILKFATGEKLGTYHCLARSLFEASHLVAEFVYEENNQLFREPVEIGLIKRLTNIQYLINPEFAIDIDDEDGERYDPEIPYKVVENLPDTDPRVMKFKCSCKEEIRVANGDWLFISCHNCGNRIFRREIEDVGNLFVYVKRKPNDKNDE